MNIHEHMQNLLVLSRQSQQLARLPSTSYRADGQISDAYWLNGEYADVCPLAPTGDSALSATATCPLAFLPAIFHLFVRSLRHRHPVLRLGVPVRRISIWRSGCFAGFTFTLL
ncbi:unnamed protein product [Heligmosomoides polygyrus]|uniref:AraC family transcriptional regulator n=1 Tax=Heligmosomoides polygyrus TaxID=6339 RepID=A0A183F6D4_HELPZ|nr:unnamed protein product [Heligmosomoides polygyrus]